MTAETFRCEECGRTDWPYGAHSPHNAQGVRVRSCNGRLVPVNVVLLRGAEVFAVPSDSTDAVHLVVGHDGKWTCGCQARTTCKHIRLVLAVRKVAD